MTAAKMAASAGSKPLSLGVLTLLSRDVSRDPLPNGWDPHSHVHGTHTTPIATRDFVWEDGSSMGMAVPGSSLDFEA